MIDIAKVRENQEAVAANLSRRGVNRKEVKKLFQADVKWRGLNEQVEKLRRRQHEISERVASARKGERERIINEAKQTASRLKRTEEELAAAARQRERYWRALPNLVEDDVPDGGEKEAVVIATSEAKPPAFGFPAKNYLELLPDCVDMERAAKVSGNRFAYLKRQLARLELGLISYAVDSLVSAGFEAVIPPVLIKEKAMAGMGYLDHEGDEVYRTQDSLYLVGTSEQSLGAMHMDEILTPPLPRRYAAYSTCFRREAGSHGRDVKGILRVHQFNKVEMFSFCLPRQSRDEHEFLLRQQRRLMDRLRLPYRVVKLAAGDLGVPFTKTYDIETWLPSEGRFRETHSTSNAADYQARRLNIRVRDKDGTVKKAHMLNGTAVAVGRTLIALVENNQRTDGSVAIPEVLHQYLPFNQIEKTASG